MFDGVGAATSALPTLRSEKKKSYSLIPRLSSIEPSLEFIIIGYDSPWKDENLTQKREKQLRLNFGTDINDQEIKMSEGEAEQRVVRQ